MEGTSLNRDIVNTTWNLKEDNPVSSSRVTKHNKLIDRYKAPNRELTQKYQSQPSIPLMSEQKIHSHRSSQNSSRRLGKDEFGHKVKQKSKVMSRDRLLKDTKI